LDRTGWSKAFTRSKEEREDNKDKQLAALFNLKLDVATIPSTEGSLHQAGKGDMKAGPVDSQHCANGIMFIVQVRENDVETLDWDIWCM